MSKELDKAYEAQKFEDGIYKSWEEGGYFVANNQSGAKPFTISMPPPNATGTLHLGHSVFLTVQDILTRFNRMHGNEALWLPGTDHASIATESKVEGILNKQGSGRKVLGREKFLKEVENFVEGSQNTIRNQCRKMGASCDWSRERYTLDEGLSNAVSAQFIKMYEDGLIYRGYRIVNWSPKAGSVLADDEVEYKEVVGKMYYIKYGPFVVATSRPETKLADTAVAVNPNDERYAKYVGQELDIDLAGHKIHVRVIADDAVDIETGSGALGVTPAHSFVDYDMAMKHKLPIIPLIKEDNTINAQGGKYAGMMVEEAQKAFVADLEAAGQIEKIEEYKKQLSVCYRTGCEVQPLPKEQWFIDVNKPIPANSAPLVDMGGKLEIAGKSLKQVMLEVVKTGQVKIVPARFEKIYYHWIENLRDWCISRQVWFGHRIPVWYDAEKKPHAAKLQKVTFIRHGQTQANADDLACGISDVPLNEIGREQAHAAAQNYKGRKIGKIVASTLGRAQETAKIIADEIGYTGEIEIWDNIYEMDLGAAELKKHYDGMDCPQMAAAENTGEGLASLFSRARNLLEKLKKEKAEGEILIFSHATFLRAVNCILNSVSQEKFLSDENKKRFVLKNCEAIEAYVMQEPVEKVKVNFVRHGEKIWDENLQDFVLSENGKNQARDFAKSFADKKVGKIISSTMMRAKQTAEYLAQEKGLPVENWEEIIEWKFKKDMPDFERHANKEDLEQYSEETLEEIFARAKKALVKLREIECDGEIVVFAHSFIISVITAIENGISAGDDFWKFRETWNLESCENKVIYVKKENLTQDSDTLDTWFSSGLWTFSTLGWPTKTRDLELFHPTSVMETGSDILFFWVARMILMTTYSLRQIPFETVYLHGLVKDRNGNKMSKSKPETCIDPLEMIEKYGTDAVRLSLIIGTSAGADTKMYEEKIKGYRNFTNKIWNTARFALMNVENLQAEFSPKTVADFYIISKLQKLVKATEENIAKYNFSEAGNGIYEFLWHEFADWYLEVSKKQKNEGVILYVLKNLLKLLHPFTPFITEVLWAELGGNSKIIAEKYPKFEENLVNEKAESDFEKIKNAIYQTRNICQGNAISRADVVYKVAGDDQELFQNYAEILQMMSYANSVKIENGTSLFVEVLGLDNAAEKARLEKEIAKIEPYLQGILKKLQNEAFVANADPALVAEEKEKLEAAQKDVAMYKERLTQL